MKNHASVEGLQGEDGSAWLSLVTGPTGNFAIRGADNEGKPILIDMGENDFFLDFVHKGKTVVIATPDIHILLAREREEGRQDGLRKAWEYVPVWLRRRIWKRQRRLRRKDYQHE